MKYFTIAFFLFLSTFATAQSVEHIYTTLDTTINLNLPEHVVIYWDSDKVMIEQRISYIGNRNTFRTLQKNGRYNITVSDTASLDTPILSKQERRIITVYVPR